MPNLGAPELLLILLVILVLFGWKKLPDMARSTGRSMRIFKSEMNEMKNEGKAQATASATDATPSPAAPPANPADPAYQDPNAPRPPAV